LLCYHVGGSEQTLLVTDRFLSRSRLTAVFALLALLPVARETTGNFSLAIFDSFYRAGSLVLGGGHVVLLVAGLAGLLC